MRGLLAIVGLMCITPAEVIVATIYPGYLALHGFWGFVLVYAALFGIAFGFGKLISLLPSKKAKAQTTLLALRRLNSENPSQSPKV